MKSAVVVAALLAVPFLDAVWLLAHDSRTSDVSVLPVPVFATERAGPPTQGLAPRSTLLPASCADVLPATEYAQTSTAGDGVGNTVDVAALLGQPMGSLVAVTVVGVAAPSVGILEQVTCIYQHNGQRFDQNSAPLVLKLAAFTDQGAAARQRDRNIAAERADTSSARPAAVGDAHATLLEQKRRDLLLLAYDRYTMTLSLAHGVVPEQNVEQVLTDLACRVWPNVAPSPPAGYPLHRR